jgi:CheY-like chemotaxis protein
MKLFFPAGGDGLEALALMKKKKPDLVILDLMMPGKDGFGVIEEIKKEKEWADITIIVVTAKDLSEKEKEELTDRAKLVIQKSGAQIEDVMHRLLERIKEKTNDQKSNDH